MDRGFSPVHGKEDRLVCGQELLGADGSNSHPQTPLLKASKPHGVCVLFVLLQVARKLVIIESDLERAEERAELSEG